MENIIFGFIGTEDINDGYLGSGRVFLKALKKYGKENFTREILEYANSREEVNELERKYVTQKEINDEMCYNMKTGGDNNQIYSEETRKKMGEIARKHMTGRKLPEEVKAKMRVSQKGRAHKKGITPWNKWLKMDDDFRNKVSEGKKGKSPSEESNVKRSASMKLKAQDPIYKQHLSDAVKEWWKTRKENA